MKYEAIIYSHLCCNSYYVPLFGKYLNVDKFLLYFIKRKLCQTILFYLLFYYFLFWFWFIARDLSRALRATTKLFCQRNKNTNQKKGQKRKKCMCLGPAPPSAPAVYSAWN